MSQSHVGTVSYKMWQLTLLLFLCAEPSAAEELTTPSTSLPTSPPTTPPSTLPSDQPFPPAQRVDSQQLLDDQEPAENEDMERALDSDPQNLLTEAVRLLQIDNVQALEEKLRLQNLPSKRKRKKFRK